MALKLPQKLFKQNQKAIENLFHFYLHHDEVHQESTEYLQSPDTFMAIEKKPSIYTLNKILNGLQAIDSEQLKTIQIDLSYSDSPQNYEDNEQNQQDNNSNNGYNSRIVEPEKILFVKQRQSYENLLLKICKQIQRQQNLQSITFNINGWSAYPYHNLSDHHISFIMKSIVNPQTVKKLKVLDINFYKLGYKNNKITQKSIDKILNNLLKLQNLETLKVNLSSFGIISDYETKKFYKHEHVIKLAQILQQNSKTLKVLSLQTRSWGYMNQDISPESLRLLGSIIGDIDNLQELDLDLHCWAYQNNFDHQGTQQFLDHLYNLVNLKKLSLKLDYFNYMIQDHFIKIIDIIMNNKQLRDVKISTKMSLFLSFIHLNDIQLQQEYRDKQIQFINHLKSNKCIKSIDLCEELVYSFEKMFKIIKAQKLSNNIKFYQFPQVQQSKISKIFRKEIMHEILEYFE